MKCRSRTSRRTPKSCRGLLRAKTTLRGIQEQSEKQQALIAALQDQVKLASRLRNPDMFSRDFEHL
jgi:hypothetical protein